MTRLVGKLTNGVEAKGPLWDFKSAMSRSDRVGNKAFIHKGWSFHCGPRQLLPTWRGEPCGHQILRAVVDGACPAGPKCDMSQPHRTPQPQTSCCEWQRRRYSRTGGWCLWCNSGDGAETTPNLFIVPLRELLSQFRAVLM